jgi:hypothetical protein
MSSRNRIQPGNNMNIRQEPLPLISTLCGAALLALAGCGGGGGDSTSAPAATTTSVSTRVIDDAIGNALVCLDKNGNGLCDVGEVQGRTDATGNVTLSVPNADVGKYPIIALVGTDAVDAKNGKVTVAYTMTAPADQVGVVSPLTTLVQQTVASTGASTADAAKAVQATTGVSTSLFQDYTQATAPTDGTLSAATVARMVVVTTQQQSAAIATALGTATIDGATITQADLDKAVQKALLQLLPALVSALSDPAVLAASPASRESALLAAAQSVIASSGLTTAGVATAVAVNNQPVAPVVATTPAPSFQLLALSFTNPLYNSMRSFASTLAQATPDSSNNTRYFERRRLVSNGVPAVWGSGSDVTRGADINWNGSAWASCPLNFENTSSVRDALGNTTYSYCDKRETGTTHRATFDIGGRTMAEVYAQIRAGTYTNLTLQDPTVLGSATFPTGSQLFYLTNNALVDAITYTPNGTNSTPGSSSTSNNYSAAVAAGGLATSQAAGVACNSTETNTGGTIASTLEGWIAAKAGTPCIYAQGSMTYNGTTFSSDASNEWWGNSTGSLGKIGTASLTPTTGSTGYYTTNTLLRFAFTGPGTNPVTYYACKERYLNGSARNCTVISTGSYTIATLGDARVLTMNNLPAQTAGLTYTRAYVERGGVVYVGFQSKPVVTNSARLNSVAAKALLAQLGMTPIEDPSTPVALTAASYQGTWDFRDAASTVSATSGTLVSIFGDNTASCLDKSTSIFFACSVSVTDPSTGAFTYTDAEGTGTGRVNFMTGIGTGTFTDSTGTGSFIAGRR